MTKFKFGLKAIAPATLPAPKILHPSRESDRIVTEQVRLAAAEEAVSDSILDTGPSPDVIEAPDGTLQEHVDGTVKLTRLIDDDFPFDESQLAAINGMLNQRFACLTGAAGTGKTTSIKKFVQELHDSSQMGQVDMDGYFRKAPDMANPDPDDDYEITERWVPSICLVGFTGRSSQMIKKNFPRDWHSNIMTIHRMLAFAPEFYEAWDEESQMLRNKMRFTPGYTRDNQLPWDIIVIDEAGMVSVDLWDQVWAACKPGTRIYMIGDINQLPPVHGRSIFGFAMTDWPSWELTHIHRQEGVNNSIVDNAWRILKGKQPISDDYKNDPSWKFAMMDIPDDSNLASQKIRKWLAAMNGKAYQPHRDSVITAINGQDDSKGYALGQIPMNRELAMVFNKENPRFIIDAGRERKHFAVGDKVMATRNDHEVGITNGMTGIIISIERHGGYAGDHLRFGEVSEVARYMADQMIDDDDDEEFSLEDLSDSMAGISEAEKKAKDAKERGPASHIVTVKFGEGDHAFEIPFASLAEVCSLMTAYVVTCHKMQGGESPLVVVICHAAHRQMLNREWLYTAVTRASRKCVLFHTGQGLRIALNKQRIVGNTLAEKVKVFQQLMTRGITGAAVNVKLPKSESFGKALALPTQPTGEALTAPTGESLVPSGFADMLARSRARKLEPTPAAKVEPAPATHIHIHLHAQRSEAQPKPAAEPKRPPMPPVDKGYLQRVKEQEAAYVRQFDVAKRMIPLAKRDVQPVSPVFTHHAASRPAPLLLTYQPKAVYGQEMETAAQKAMESIVQLAKPIMVEQAKPTPVQPGKFRFGKKG